MLILAARKGSAIWHWLWSRRCPNPRDSVQSKQPQNTASRTMLKVRQMWLSSYRQNWEKPAKRSPIPLDSVKKSLTTRPFRNYISCIMEGLASIRLLLSLILSIAVRKCLNSQKHRQNLSTSTRALSTTTESASLLTLDASLLSLNAVCNHSN